MGRGDSCQFRHTNFCFGATKFVVKIIYGDDRVRSQIYDVTCSPTTCATGDDWHDCEAVKKS